MTCADVAPGKGPRDILSVIGKHALTEGQSAWTARGVIVSSSVGGDNLGTISPNTPVRVICKEDENFALIKQERGYPDGVVEIGALEVPPNP